MCLVTYMLCCWKVIYLIHVIKCSLQVITRAVQLYVYHKITGSDVFRIAWKFLKIYTSLITSSPI